MNRLYTVFALFLMFCLYMNAEQATTARSLGMGGAFTAISDDASAIAVNPGGLSLLDERSAAGDFSRLYWGVNKDNIGRGFLSYSQRAANAGSFGFGFKNLFSKVYSENTIYLGYGYDFGRLSPEIGKLGIGINGKLHLNGYNKSNFRNNPEEIVPISESPLFNDGTDKTGFSLDFGALYKPSREWSFGLMLKNINQPDMSLSGFEEGALPLSAVLGASWLYQNNIRGAIDLKFINQKINDGNKFSYNIGAEYLFEDNRMAVRTGVNPENYSFGAGYFFNTTKPAWEISYAFLYPLSKLGKVGTTHHFSVSMRLPYPAPPPPRVNLTALRLYANDKLKLMPDDKTVVTGVIRKKGNAEFESVPVILLAVNPKGTIEFLGRKTINSMNDGDTVSVSWDITLRQSGEYSLIMRVDDMTDEASASSEKALLPPDIRSTLAETDEYDNITRTTIIVGKPSNIAIDLQANSLLITKASIRRTEEPQIPIVFFEPKSVSVDRRYDYMLKRITERLEGNPNAKIVLRGFISPSTDDNERSLARERAETVLRRMILLGANPAQVMVDTSGYNVLEQRAREQYALPKDLDMVTSENRRVELSVKLDQSEGLLVETVGFAQGGDFYSASDNEKTTLWRRLLSNNRDLVILVEGISGKNEKGDMTLGLRRADAVRKGLLKALPEYNDRIFIFDRQTENIQGSAKISVLSDGILYRPYESSVMPDKESLSQRENRIFVEYHTDIDITSHNIAIENEKGEIVRTISKGEGAPKRDYSWDWTDDDGNILAPGHRYYAVGRIDTKTGQKALARSDSITVEVKEIVEIVENILIVNFEFDTPDPTSNYFETRLDMTARKFVESSLRKDFKLSATIEGNTDVTGQSVRNIELSEERARREFNNIKRYIKYLLDIKEDSELDNWMKSNGSSLINKGLGSSKPYEIVKHIEGSDIPVLVGDNNLPEGRGVNRRVVIEYKLLPR